MANPAGQLARQLQQLLPGLGPFASVVALLIILIGLGAVAYDLLSRLRTATGPARERVIQEWVRLLHQVANHPLSREWLQNSGSNPDEWLRQVTGSLAAVEAAAVPPYQPPINPTRQQLELWYAAEALLWSHGRIDRTRIDRAYSYYVTSLAVMQVPELAAPSAPRGGTTTVTGGAGAAGPTVNVTVPTPTVVVQVPPVAPPSVLVQVPPAAVPTINVAAPAAPSVTVSNTVDTASLGQTLAAAMPLVGATLSQTMLANAQNYGHLLQLGQSSCFGTTAGRLLNLALPIGLGVFTLQQLRSETGIGGFVQGRIQQFFASSLDPARFPHPATPENVFQTASARLKEAFEFGLQAHMWSVLAEANYFTKQLGLGQVAGFMADLAGFQRIAVATMGEVERAALATPMRYLAQRTYRPNLPAEFFAQTMYQRNHLSRDQFRGILEMQGYRDDLIEPYMQAYQYVPPLPDLELMYAKKEILPEAAGGRPGFRDAMRVWGAPDEWLEVYEDHLWMDPRLTEIVRIGQFFNPVLVESLAKPDQRTAEWMRRAGIPAKYIDSPDWYYAWRAAKGGYDPRDVPIIAETAKRATARREQTLFLDAATRLNRDGFITAEALRPLVVEAWGFSDPITARTRATELQTQYRVLTDTRELALQAMARGLLTPSEARSQLTGIGMDPTRVELEVLRATVGLVTRQRLEVTTAEDFLEASAELVP